MARRLFTLLSALSLLLCVAVVVLWVRGPWHGSQSEWATPATSYGLESTAGGFTAYARHLTPIPAGVQAPEIELPKPAETTVRVPRAPVRRLNLPGLRVEQGLVGGGTVVTGGAVFTSSDTYSRVTVRWWLAALSTAVLPTAWLWRATRAGPTPGSCSSCGYDLTFNISGACPECGRAVGKGVA